MTDPIADMLTRIKNAYLARKEKVAMPYSNVKNALAQVLLEKKYISDIQKVEKEPQADLILTLVYSGKLPILTDIKRVSKPGRRVYTTVDRIPRTLGGHGTTIVSTSKGVMTDTKAKQLGLGGEVLCQVW